jgi:hypothetical protein
MSFRKSSHGNSMHPSGIRPVEASQHQLIWIGSDKNDKNTDTPKDGSGALNDRQIG